MILFPSFFQIEVFFSIVSNIDNVAPDGVTNFKARYDYKNRKILLSWKEPSNSDYAKLLITSGEETIAEVSKGTISFSINNFEADNVEHTYKAVTYDKLGNYDLSKAVIANVTPGDNIFISVYRLDYFTSNNNSLATAFIKGENFISEGTTSSDFTLSCDTNNIVSGNGAGEITIVSDSELKLTLLRPSTAGTYPVTLTYSEKSYTFDYVIYEKGAVTPSFVKVNGATVTGSVEGSRVFITDRSVTIPDMWVSDHEVTQGEYENYCAYYSSSYTPSSAKGLGFNYPAYNVCWYDAIVYCNLRSIDKGLTPVYSIGGVTDPRQWTGIKESDGKYCYGATSKNDTWYGMTYNTSANGYRLPTEAEWEYIARGGNNGIPESQTTYSGSNDIAKVAWYFSNSNSTTHEVKGKTANTLGIYERRGMVLGLV